jgi:DNA invertase Pin-like site-specific DNA recombinase
MTTSEGKRAVIYGRVSRDRHGEGRSVDSQLKELRVTAERERWDVVAEYRDDGVGASRYSQGTRAGWPSVIALVTSGGVDVLAIWELSRATRDRQVFAALLAACEEQGVRLHAGGRYLDPADPDQAFGLDVEAAVAVREAGAISKRTRRGQAHAAAQGRPHGPSIWPYRRRYDERGALESVELIPERVTALKEAANTVLTGGTLTAAALKINGAGLDPDREFSGRTLRRLLMTPTTAGLRVHQGRVVGEGSWPAVFSLDTHQKLVVLLTQTGRRTTTDNITKHLLPGVALCGRCGGLMHRVGGTSRPPRLVCSVSPHVSHQQESAESYVERVVVRRLQRPDVLDAWQPKSATSTADAAESVKSLKRQLGEWEDAAAEGTVTPAAFGRIEARLSDKIALLEAAAKTVEVPEVLVKVTKGDVPSNWKALPITRKREVIRLIGAPRILPGRAPVEKRVIFPWETT